MGKLTTKGRKRMKRKEFAIPEDKAYPINDKAHARNALARVEQHGTAGEKARVRKAVAERYPSIDQEDTNGTKGKKAKKAKKGKRAKKAAK
jgi:hypothetical protein